MNPKTASITQAFSPALGDLVRVGSTRRGFLQTGLAGLAGVSMPSLLQQQALAAVAGQSKSKTNVILFWHDAREQLNAKLNGLTSLCSAGAVQRGINHRIRSIARTPRPA